MGLHGREQQLSLLEPTFLTNGGVPRQRERQWRLTMVGRPWVRPNRPHLWRLGCPDLPRVPGE